jgi:hypothetical protein
MKKGYFDPETSWPEQVTFGIAGTGLGDIWRSVQYACHVNQSQGVDVSLYSGWHGWPGLDFSHVPIADKSALIQTTMSLLDTPGRFRLVRKADLSKVVFTQWFKRYGFPVVPTKIRWKGWSCGRRPRLACQLVGVANAHGKNPPRRDLSRLLKPLPGVVAVPLGRHLGVRACVETLASSDLFFGVDSGMMQLAYSVGVPAILLTYNADAGSLSKWHGDRCAVQCGGTGDFLHLVRAFWGRED